MTDISSVVSILPVIVRLLAQEPVPLDSSDDFSPMMLVILFAVLAVCLVLVGIGVVLALVGMVCTAMLTALGVVSSSVVFALLRRRISSGVRALHYQVCAAVAAPAGVTLLWLTSALFDLHLPLRVILPFGLLAGCASGLLIAGVFDWAARLAYRRLLTMSGTDVAPDAALPG